MPRYPETLIYLAKLVEARGGELYAVGGQVRNPLLGLMVSDRDVTSALTPQEVLELARENGIMSIEKGAAFGTVELHIGAESYEHTTFRSDSYGAGGGHRPDAVRFTGSLREDAFRRDFTVNALYERVLGGVEIVDPTGGMADIERRLIRATSADPDIIMRDDALRIMRMVRFASELGFTVEEKTLDSAKRNVRGLEDISKERIRDELIKILLSDARYGESGAVLKGLELLDSIGALDVILPELTLGRGIAQREQYHAYDVLSHSLHTAASAPPELELRLAGLLHDVGKPPAYLETGMMRDHDKRGEPITREILLRLRFPNDTIDTVCALVRRHMYDLTGSAKEPTLREKFADWGYFFSLMLCDVRESDVHGSGIITGEVATAKRWREIIARMQAEGAPFCESELNCTGADIMRWLDIPPSKQVGEIKRRLLMHCARTPRDNTPARLEIIAKGMK